MIIYGWRAKEVQTKSLPNVRCQSCSEYGVLMSVFAKYFHIFWIPLFPYKKIAYFVCQNCQADFEDKNMQDEYQSTISEAKRNAGTPVYLFAGLVVFPLLIAAMLFFEAKETTEYFANPQINDLYVVESVEQETEYPYLILKLFEVEPDSLAFHMGRYAYQSGYDAESAINGSKIYDSDYFASEELKIAKNEIDLEQIDRIIRPGKDFSRFVDN